MTLFDVEELTCYWLDHPPLHMVLAAHFGFGRSRQGRAGDIRTRTGSRPRADDAARLAIELGAGFASGDVHAGLEPVVLDFAELRRKAVAS